MPPAPVPFEQIEAGRYVVFQTRGFYARAITAFTGSKFTHAAVYLGSGKIVQADSKGIHVDTIERYKGAPAVANLGEPMTDEQRTIVCATARAYVGLSYSWQDIAVIALRHLDIRWHWLEKIADDPDELMCSYSVAKSGVAAGLTGWLCGEQDPAFVVPGALAKRPGMVPVSI